MTVDPWKFLVSAVGGDTADAVCRALHDWIPSQAQCVLDEANATINQDLDWMKADELAGQAELLARAARACAGLSHALLWKAPDS